MNMIQDNLHTVLTKIRKYEERYHRPKGSVLLLAVSKNQSIEKIKAAITAGQHIFGENYLQEALTKMAELSDYNLEWHFIGPIQRNKTRKIAEHFQWVHSVDSTLIADRLNEQRPAHLPPLNICLEVNISNEATKSGVSLQHIEALAHHCQRLPHLKLRGLMAIPAPKSTLIEQRAELAGLKALFYDLKKTIPSLDTLSMGMSNDLEAAIAEGATMVRIGTSIFGDRI